MPEDQPQPKALSTKQRLFVAAYIGEAHGNATKAARLAGYQGNDVTLASVGSDNLKIPQIAERVESFLAGVEAEALALRRRIHFRTLSQLDALSELAVDSGGKALSLEEWGRLYDRVKPPDPSKHEHTGKDGGALTIRVVYEDDPPDHGTGS